MALERGFLVVGLSVTLSACGLGGGESDIRPLKVHALSLEPSCWVPPPPVEIPPAMTPSLVRIAQEHAAADLERGLLCAERYRAMAEAIRQDPHAPEWVLQPHETGYLSMHIRSEPQDRGPVWGRFDVEMFDVTADPEGRDVCTRGGAGREQAEGTYTDGITVIVHRGLYVRWNDDAVAMTIPGPFGDFGLFIRGCDRESGVSFGRLVSYDTGPSMKCWNSNGFVSCDGIDTWPFEF